jgi:hypothetical protein
MTWLLNPRTWLAIALLAALSAVFGSGWRLGSANIRADLERLRADHMLQLAQASDRALTAERQAREAEANLTERERALAAEIEAQSAEARREKQALADSAAAAHHAADSLRQQLAQLTAAARQPGVGGPADPAATPARQRPGLAGPDALDLLADLLAGRSRELVEVAATADALMLAGLGCERIYDAARAALVAGAP